MKSGDHEISAAIFRMADSDEDEEPVIIPKGAKLSKNTGREAQKKAIIQSNRQRDAQRGIMGEYSSQVKNHHLHRPLAMYFQDKKEMQKEAIMEAKMEEELRKTEIEIWIRELKKIKKIILLKKNMINVCLLCKRKFPDFDSFDLHEKKSELHKRNKKLKVTDSKLGGNKGIAPQEQIKIDKGKHLEEGSQIGEEKPGNSILMGPEEKKIDNGKFGSLAASSLMQIKFVKN